MEMLRAGLHANRDFSSYPHSKVRRPWGPPPPRTSEGRSNVFQGVHPHVKREEKFSLEQYVFTPTP